MGGFAETAFSALIIEQGLEQGLLSEIGPEYGSEIKFAVCYLPQQEIADTLFSACTYQKIRIRNVFRRQSRGDGLLVDPSGGKPAVGTFSAVATRPASRS